MGTDTSTLAESVYIVRGGVPPAAITSSLQALLPVRRHPIARRRFTLLDTFDGRVARAGGRLTRAGVNGATTMAWQPRGGRNRMEVRLDHPVTFAWDLPDGPLQHVLAPVLGVRGLLAQAEAEEHGSLLDVLDDRGKTVVRVRIESGRARLPMSHNGWQLLPTMITLTALRGYEDEYKRLVPVIESRPGLEYCPEGSVGVILRAVGAPGPCDVSTRRVNLSSSVLTEAGARQVHQTLLGIIVANEPGLRAALDTEFLHDFRVAVRRTRSLLGQIKHVFPPDIVEHFSTEFSWLGRLTGAPRDMDVLLLALRKRMADVPADDLAALTAFLGDAQQQEQRKLVEALDGERYRRLVSEWQAFLQRPTTCEPVPLNARSPLVEVVCPRAWRLYRRIVRCATTIDGGTEPARLHEVRITAKKLRYLVDVTTSFNGARDHERILGRLKALQRVLGDFNDAHVQEQRLLECGRTLGAAGGPPGALLAIGRLAEQSRQHRDILRGQVGDELARFCAHEMRSACRRAFKRVAAPVNAR
jgi:CHAD domain-containing protein